MNKGKLWLCVVWFVVGLLIMLTGSVSTFNYGCVWVALLAELLEGVFRE